MSESIGKSWIESSVVEILVDHAHELPSPSKLQGRAQIVKFLTFREDTGDGSQPKDRNTVLWAEITDGKWIIPVRIANEATNKIEDEYKRALTYYRRGYFTLKAAVSFDFVVQQINKSQIKLSPLKQLLLDIVELHYISGGGPGVPVTTGAVALQAPPAFFKWVQVLNTGGQTLMNLQAQERAVKGVIRPSKAISRRSNATSVSKRHSKAPIKTSAQSVTPQSSTNNLAAKREWQEGWFGKRPKFHGVDYIPRPEGFTPTDDQQAKFESILERIKMATPTHPYDPTNMDHSSSAPDRPGIPSTLRSSQVIRSSQVVSSTPVDVRLPRSNPFGSQLRTSVVADEPVDASSEAESNEEDSDSDHVAAVRSRQAPKPAVNQTNRVGHSRSHIPTPRPSDPHADESHEEVSPGVEGKPRSLEADDAITEQVLSQAFASGNQRRGALTVLVPDSDPPNPGQRPTQVRHSSPWDCESGLSSERDISYSPEATRHSPTKGKQRLSSTLSSPSRSILDVSRDEFMGSQLIGQMTSSAKQQGSSGQVESQPSAAASLPSPPPEDSNGHKLNLQQLEPVLSRPLDEIITLATNLPHTSDTIFQRDSRKDLHEEQGELFETRLRVGNIISRKRRLSQSPGDDAVQPSQELALSQGGKSITDNPRRLDNSHVPTLAHKNAPRQLNIAREGPVNEPRMSSNATEPTAFDNRTGMIPHDHDAWANPSWMNNVPSAKQVKPVPTKAPRTSDVRPLDKPQTRRIPRSSTGLRIVQPPFHYPTRIVELAPSPEFPPVTASQFADADEDFGVASSKLEPLAPARPANKPVASTSRADDTVQSRPTPRGQPAASIPGPSKQSRASGKLVGNSARVAQGREHTVRNERYNSEGKGRLEKSNRPLTVHHPTPDNSLINSEVRPDDSATSTAQSLPTHRPYLGGFQPSITVDLPRKYQWTWENWLEVTKDAYSFWLE